MHGGSSVASRLHATKIIRPKRPDCSPLQFGCISTRVRGGPIRAAHARDACSLSKRLWIEDRTGRFTPLLAAGGVATVRSGDCALMGFGRDGANLAPLRHGVLL